jgi:hypothetical protein
MAIDADALKNLIAGELAGVSDARIVKHVRELLIEPEPVLRDWDYEKGQQYLCWTVLKHDSGTGIAFCENGFGPKCPWGLVWLEGKGGYRSMGMDSAWFTTFVQAYFDSFASADLPIWRVFKIRDDGTAQPITEEAPWDEAWERVYELRKTDPQSRYYCDCVQRHQVPE